MAKVNGNRLRAYIKLYEMKLVALVATFDTQLNAFPGEEKNPDKLMEEIVRLQKAIAVMQSWQAQYNVKVTAIVNGNPFSLSYLVKYLGMAGQTAKMWRSAIPKKERYGRDLTTRRTDEEIAVPVLSYEALVERAFEAQKLSNDIQSAIATANSIEMEVPQELFNTVKDILPEGLVI